MWCFCCELSSGSRSATLPRCTPALFAAAWRVSSPFFPTSRGRPLLVFVGGLSPVVSRLPVAFPPRAQCAPVRHFPRLPASRCWGPRFPVSHFVPRWPLALVLEAAFVVPSCCGPHARFGVSVRLRVSRGGIWFSALVGRLPLLRAFLGPFRLGSCPGLVAASSLASFCPRRDCHFQHTIVLPFPPASFSPYRIYLAFPLFDADGVYLPSGPPGWWFVSHCRCGIHRFLSPYVGFSAPACGILCGQ